MLPATLSPFHQLGKRLESLHSKIIQPTFIPSTEAREVQSEGGYADGRRNESRLDGYRRFWWNTNGVANLAEQMNHLTPVEKT